MKSLYIKNSEQIYASIFSENNLYVIPPVYQPDSFSGDTFLWIINEQDNCFTYITTDGTYKVSAQENQKHITFSSEFIRKDFEGYPRCDFLGNTFEFDMGDDGALTETLAYF